MAETDQGRALVLGIDTGGTYTDGVLMDYRSRRVLATHKSLTTKHDFSIGIERVIENIQIEEPTDVRMVSISTTLATNAIAEGKGKRVGLLLIGYDQELVESFELARHFATPEFHYFAGGHDLHGQEKESLDLAGLLAKVNEIKADVDALAVSSYFSPLNPEHEQRAREAISRICGLPIVLGSQLSSKLGSIERATTAALNASLLAVLQDFVIAVRRSMERRQIRAPLMVVRGDGTLMSDEFAARSPVETIHSGPAASAIGGRFLSGEDCALVIDIGGTTTDLALVLDGEVAISEQGARVAEYKTAVKAAHLLSIGIGGDSHVTLTPDKEIRIGPQRVVPLSHLADKHPEVKRRLMALTKRTWSSMSQEWLEYWFLQRVFHPEEHGLEPRHQQLLERLREHPLPLPEILDEMGLLHRNQLNVEPLFRDEILGKAGLTPTDFLHHDGRYSPWDLEAARAVCWVFSQLRLESVEQVLPQIWGKMTEAVLAAVVSFLTGREVSADPSAGAKLDSWFFSNSLSMAHPHLETSFHLRHPIIGIGAPAAIFLPAIAEALNTKLILPDHYEVANAVGAVGGSVMVEEEVLVYPQLSGKGLDVIGYFLQDGDGRRQFEKLDEALAAARARGEQRTRAAALRAGAENPQLVMEEVSDGLDSFRLRIRALGSPRLSR